MAAPGRIFRSSRGASLALACAAALPGCGPAGAERAPGSPAAGPDGYPRAVELAAETLWLQARPERIVPANAGLVDFLTVLVEPARVAAVPRVAHDYSRLPRAGAGWTELPTFVGTDAETLLARRPDLVLSSPWQGPETTAQLRAHGVAVASLTLPRTWSEVLATLETCGRLLAVEDRARGFAAELEERRQALLERAHPLANLRALSYSNLGAGGTAGGSGTTAQVLFELAGLLNAAAESGLDGWVTLDKERLLQLDPDVIVVGAEAPAESGASAGRSPTEAWLRAQEDLSGLTALTSGRLITLEPRLFTATSFELLDAAGALVDALLRRD